MQRLRQIQAGDDARSETLRALGGLFLGIGFLVLIERRSSFNEPWGDFPLFLAWLIPAVVLYGGGILAARAAAPKAWHAVWVVFGIAFVYGTLLQFLTLIDGNTDAPLNTVWTLCVVAAAGGFAALFARVRFGWLIAGIALAIAWLALWDEILENGIGDDAGTFRGLCMVAALLLVAGAWMLERRGREGTEAAEVVTAAGLIFLLGAGIVSLSGVFASLFVPPGLASSAAVPGAPEPSLFWDLVLLGGSLALIGAGNLVALRGPVYVGSVGILIFIISVGLDLDDDSPAGKVIGWPLILLVAAAALIAASAFRGRRSVGA
jgi:hypothetical protein